MMEENAQMSLLPDAAVAAQMTMTGEEEIDLSEYEIVRPEFFAHIKEPALTVNVDKIGVNTACVRLMGILSGTMCSKTMWAECR